MERHVDGRSEIVCFPRLHYILIKNIETRKQNHRERRIRAIQWLQPANMREHHERNIASIADGTCEWVLSHPAFLNWGHQISTTSEERFLIIHGRAGCGKSILSSYLHNMSGCTTSRDQNNIGEGTNETLPLLFSFSSTDTARQTPASLSRTLLGQLVDHYRQDLILNEISRLMDKSSVSTSDLYDTLGHVIGTISTPVCLTIDGVDEYCGPLEDFFQRLIQLSDRNTLMKIILLGQSHCFSPLLRSRPGIHVIPIVPELNHDDIQTLARTEVEQAPEFWSDSIRQSVLHSLLTKAEGMFLWIRLMLDYLKSAPSAAELYISLERLPDGLEQAYSFLLDRLSLRLRKSEQTLVQRLFSMITASGRPLTYSEIQSIYALAMELDSDSDNTESFTLRIAPEDIVRLCGGFVTFTDERFRVVHNSARDFLIRSSSDWNAHPAPRQAIFGAPLTQSHKMLSGVCMKVFQQAPGLETSFTYESHHGDLEEPLIDYACLYAAYHLHHSDKDPTEIRSCYNHLLQSNRYFQALEELTSRETIDAENLNDNLKVWDHLWTVIQERSHWNNGENTIVEPGENISLIGDNAMASEPSSGIEVMRNPTPSAGNTSQPSEEPSHFSTRNRFLSQATMSTSEPNSRLRTYRMSDIPQESSSMIQVLPTMLTGSHFDFSLTIVRRVFMSKALLDPFTVLWNRIRLSLDSMSPMAMTAVTWYCYRIKKIDEAVEIGTKCSEKLKNSDTIIRLMHDAVMADVFDWKEDYAQAISHLERARKALAKPNRQRLRETFIDQLSLMLARCYQQSGEDSIALDMMYTLKKDRMHKLDITKKLRLYYRLGLGEYYSLDGAKAIEHLHMFLELYKKHNMGHEGRWNRWPRSTYVHTLALAARSFFALFRDDEAIAHFHQLRYIRQTHDQSLSSTEKKYIDCYIEEFDTYLSTILILRDKSTDSLKLHIEHQCNLHGMTTCKEELDKIFEGSDLLLWKDNIVRKRVEQFFLDYRQAYIAAHSCTGEECKSYDNHALHLSYPFFTESSTWNVAGNTENAIEALWDFIDSFKKHFRYPIDSDTGYEPDPHLAFTTHNLSWYLGDFGNVDDLIIAAYSARVASHFDVYCPMGSVTKGEIENTQKQLINSYRWLWEALATETVNNENVAARIKVLSELQSMHIDRRKLQKLYICTETLLLPETWSAVKQKYLCGREWTLPRRPAEMA